MYSSALARTASVSAIRWLDWLLFISLLPEIWADRDTHTSADRRLINHQFRLFTRKSSTSILIVSVARFDRQLSICPDADHTVTRPLYRTRVYSFSSFDIIRPNQKEQQLLLTPIDEEDSTSWQRSWALSERRWLTSRSGSMEIPKTTTNGLSGVCPYYFWDSCRYIYLFIDSI